MMGVSSGCGLCPWSCSGKVGAYDTPWIHSCFRVINVLVYVRVYQVSSVIELSAFNLY